MQNLFPRSNDIMILYFLQYLVYKHFKQKNVKHMYYFMCNKMRFNNQLARSVGEISRWKNIIIY